MLRAGRSQPLAPAVVGKGGLSSWQCFLLNHGDTGMWCLRVGRCHLCNPAGGSAQSGPCCCHRGMKPWGMWPCGQGSGHSRLVCPLNGSGVWRAVVPSSFLLWGCPGRDWANLMIMGLLCGGLPAWHPQVTGCHAWGCREGASRTSDVPAPGLPLQGGQLKQPPHPHQWTEQPFSSSHGSDRGLAGNTGCLVLPQPALLFSPGQPPSFPVQGLAAAGGPS